MSTDLGASTITVDTEIRTARVEIDSPLGAVPNFFAFREKVITNTTTNTVISKEAYDTVQSDFQTMVASGASVTLASGVVITAAQMAEAIPLMVQQVAAAIAAKEAAAAPTTTPAPTSTTASNTSSTPN